MEGAGIGIELAEWLDVRGRAELAVWAEQQGFRGAYMAEITDPDVFVTMGLAGASTTRIRLAPLVAQIGPRTPVMLASSAATVADIAPGRFVLGIGVSSAAVVEGWHGLPWTAPLVRARETVELIRSVLAGERTASEGREVRSKGFRLARVPSTPPPIFLGAVNPGMLRVASEVADGVMLTYLPIHRASDVVGTIESHAAAAGRPRPEIVLSVICEVTDDPAATRKRLREVMLFYMSVPAYRRFFSQMGYEQEMVDVEAAFNRRDKEGVRRGVTDAFLDAITVIGSASQVRDRLAEYQAAGIDSPAVAAMDPSVAPATFSAVAPGAR